MQVEWKKIKWCVCARVCVFTTVTLRQNKNRSNSDENNVRFVCRLRILYSVLICVLFYLCFWNVYGTYIERVSCICLSKKKKGKKITLTHTHSHSCVYTIKYEWFFPLCARFAKEIAKKRWPKNSCVVFFKWIIEF